MRSSVICFIFISVASVCLARPQTDLYSNQDGFVFPGVADRPDKFPLNPHNPGWQDPGIGGGNNGGVWQQPGFNRPNNGDLWQRPGNDWLTNGDFWLQPGNGVNNGGSWQQPGNGGNNGGSWQQPGNGGNNGGSWQPPTTNNDYWSTNTTPTTTQAPVTSGAGQSTTDSPAYTRCFNSCQATSEYNPVCGSDGVVYSNPGRLGCANTCGKRKYQVTVVRFGPCDVNGSARG
ncbi:endo-1,4-beta-xylanase C-like isoform X1 [Trichogramma pretiosum]|uniref:endo-1,4-beta-xylanase C-like isoform X1 n=1 Tax=Trichogramma pretiosum TaxID=7493 RepID=UPI0006C98270|nr:endo-1,4-beta-xylanase C-like isoform X1 [Trichogramma pretiosum]